MSVFVGVDVGTGSARAGVFDTRGTLLASHKHDIQMWRAAGGIAEQSSDDIWSAVCACVKEAVKASGANPSDVKGLGFDAACSMVVLDQAYQPISISASGEADRNVIVWMDHRATPQAERINATGHTVLDYVGGRISPEMQTPKLLWLKEHMPDTYFNAGQFFDLPDYLTWAATGMLTRSACTVTCKWTYLAHEDRWDDSYFQEIGLPELPEEGFARIGQKIATPGSALGSGLTARAAADLGLPEGTPVGAGLIDAHAGGIGTVGADPHAGPESLMAYVFGTSACTMATTADAQKVPGVWGPYYSAMVPGMWLSEGGQSAAGEAIAHLISVHPATPEAEGLAGKTGQSLQGYLLSVVDDCLTQGKNALGLVGQRMIVPDLLGNRAPFADPAATGVVAGLTLAQDLDDLLATYVAAVFGVGYGLRQIMDVQARHGVSPSAMLGTVANNTYPSLVDAMGKMSRIDQRFEPAADETAMLHGARFAAFLRLQEAERLLRQDLEAICQHNFDWGTGKQSA